MRYPLMSLIIATARDSYALWHLPEEHIFAETMRTLEAQTFRDFEVIFVDRIAKRRNLRKELEAFGKWTFRWKVIEPKSQWDQFKMWALQAAFNQGAQASRGDHLMFCGDCCRFEPFVLDRAAALINQGYSPHALHCFRKKGYILGADYEAMPYRTIEELKAAGLYHSTGFLSDSRVRYLVNGPLPPEKCDWTWFYGYGFVSRDDFFAVNGWDENFDGDKGLGDVEMGSRLQMAGRFRMYLDPDLYVYEEQHFSISPLVTAHIGPDLAIRSNLDLIYLMREKGIWRANSTRYDPKDMWRVIRAEISRNPAWPNYPDDETNPNIITQRFWIENPSVFELHDPRDSHSRVKRRRKRD